MSLEQVGKCDEIIWSNFSSKVQEPYHPFRDKLDTIMKIIYTIIPTTSYNNKKPIILEVK